MQYGSVFVQVQLICTILFFFFGSVFSNFIIRNEKGYINEEIGGEIVSFFFSIGFEGEIEKLIDRVSG